MPLATSPEVGTAEWWLLRLLRKLADRQPTLQRWGRYYDGDQPLAFASSKFREAFGDRFPAFTSNFSSLVVDGTAERLEVQGFRFGGQAADDTAWGYWQDNDMDAGSQLAHTEALIKGCSYALVEPSAGGPLITIEDACDAIVEPDPKSRTGRRAGLKRWVDDDGFLIVYLYLPDDIYKYRTKNKWTSDMGTYWTAPLPWADGYEWKLWNVAAFEPLIVDGEAWPLPNPLGVVPLVELANRQRLKGYGQSEIAPIRSNQDAVNKYRCDALIASEFAAFPQRYLLNFEPETDPDTGGVKAPFKAAIDRLWTVPPPDPDLENAKEPKFGQFAAADLSPYTSMIELEVGHIASISRLPYHYLLGSPQTVPPSGESLKSSEAGLVRKVGRCELFMGEGWEEVMRVALLAGGDTAAADFRAAETVWVDSETRNEATRVDAVVKLHAQGIIDDQLAQELAGLTRQQIADLATRVEAAKAAEDKAAAEAAANQPAPPAAPGEGAPLQLVPAPTGPRMSPVAPGSSSTY